jgi:hypothetical protein
MRTLPTHRQSAPMPYSTIGTEVHQPLYRLLNLAPQIAFDFAIGVYDLADSDLLVCRQFIAIAPRVDLGLFEYLECGRPTDPVDVGKRNLHPLVPGQFNSRDACHRTFLPLSLALLVARIRAENSNHTLTAHHFAVLANFLD